jgi:hypothetical protein
MLYYCKFQLKAKASPNKPNAIMQGTEKIAKQVCLSTNFIACIYLIFGICFVNYAAVWKGIDVSYPGI